jgi:Flp pilus assembly protein TadG
MRLIHPDSGKRRAAINQYGDTMKLLREESGQTVVLVAVIMGLLAFGFMAFALDAGTLFHAKRMAQSAADAAAVAAAEEVGYGNASNEQAVANAMAKLNGFDTTLAKNPATVTLSTPTTGNYTGSYVQATVTMPVHTLYWGAFSLGKTTVPVSATAIAGGGTSTQTDVCVNGNFSLSGGSTLDSTGYGVFVNGTTNGDGYNSGSIQVSGGSTIDAASLGGASTGWTNINNDHFYGSGSTGYVDGNQINLQNTSPGVSTPCAATLPPVPSDGTCLNDPGTAYVSPGSITDGPTVAGGTICYKALTVGGNGMKTTLTPGIYVITTGELHFTGNGNMASGVAEGGNGIFFYLMGTASLVMDGGASANLVSGGANMSSGGAAASTGVYDGVLVFQDPADTQPMTFTGGSSSYMNGAIVAPNAAVTINGGVGSTVEGGIDAGSLTISGGAHVKAILDTPEGSLTVYSAKPRLVQ